MTMAVASLHVPPTARWLVRYKPPRILQASVLYIRLTGAVEPFNKVAGELDPIAS